MASKRISQREARKLAKRVAELEAIFHQQRSVWCQDFIGTEIARTEWTDAYASVPQAIRVARRLGHAVVAIGADTGLVRFVALPHAKVGA